MKKYVFAVLFLCLSLSLFGCSGNDQNTTTTTERTTVEETEQTTEEITAETTTETTAVGNMPSAYQDILDYCIEIIEAAEERNLDLNDLNNNWESLHWFADQALHADGNPKDILCYSLTDLNKDGIDELILASKYITDD